MDFLLPVLNVNSRDLKMVTNAKDLTSCKYLDAIKKSIVIIKNKQTAHFVVRPVQLMVPKTIRGDILN